MIIQFGTCRKCWVGGTRQIIDDPCSTPGCDGVVQPDPNLMEFVDVLPEPVTCPLRMMAFGPWEVKPNLDHWYKHKSNGDRVCSFCGSLHFEDFRRLVAECVASNAESCQIEQTTKVNKVYIHRPGILNAMQGAIKFYHHHVDFDGMSDKQLKEANALYTAAVNLSRQRLHAPPIRKTS